MKRAAILLAAGVAIASPALAAPPVLCPITYSRLSMPINHEKGISTPTVELAFTNVASRKIVRAKFALSIINPQGDPIPWDHDLTFTEGAAPGELTTVHWSLDMSKVDMQHLGETIYLKSARFDDDTTWQDDGNQRCKREEYYGPK